MNSSIYHFFIIYIILFFYIGSDKNIVLADTISCKNADNNCYRLNELLDPCFFKLDFNEITYFSGMGLGKYYTI
jgi:hypothetical protein